MSQPAHMHICVLVFVNWEIDPLLPIELTGSCAHCPAFTGVCLWFALSHLLSVPQTSMLLTSLPSQHQTLPLPRLQPPLELDLMGLLREGELLLPSLLPSSWRWSFCSCKRLFPPLEKLLMEQEITSRSFSLHEHEPMQGNIWKLLRGP